MPSDFGTAVPMQYQEFKDIAGIIRDLWYRINPDARNSGPEFQKGCGVAKSRVQRG
jgi:hypothetical protein